MITTNCPIPFSDFDCVLLAHGGGETNDAPTDKQHLLSCFPQFLVGTRSWRMRNRRRSQKVSTLLPIPDAVRGASEILGLDPLYIANEGLVLVILPDEKDGAGSLPSCRIIRKERTQLLSAVFRKKGYALVKMKTLYGNYRIVDMLSDEQLPRI